jgi:hypothetical protein
MSFHEMDPDKVRQILDARDEKGNKLYEDLLTPLIVREQALFRNSKCPTCGGGAVEPTLHSSRPFSPGSALPNKVLRCVLCKTEFDPYTGLVTFATLSRD